MTFVVASQVCLFRAVVSPTAEKGAVFMIDAGVGLFVPLLVCSSSLLSSLPAQSLALRGQLGVAESVT